MNNIFQMLGAIKNPQQFIQQAMQNSQLMQNPMTRNAIEMYQRGDSQGIDKMVENLCKERGVKKEDVLNQIMSQFGMN